MTAYEPGTVAVATVRGVPNVRVMRRELSDSPYEWQSAVPLAEMFAHHDRDVTDVRPLVVLDLNDCPHIPQSVLRLAAKAIDDGRSGYEPEARMLRDWADQIEAQTRPPKPAEPTGLGAVVEDDCGDLWVRVKGVQWVCGEARRPWSSFNAVHILSPGVSDV